MAANTLPTSVSTKSGKLFGKVAVVTASTDGIGLAIAERLGADGASVMISSRKENNVQKAVKLLQSKGYSVAGTVCHVSKAADREKMFKETESKFGGIDILVSNAAANPFVGPLLDCPEEAWDKVFDTNLKSSFMLSKDVLPYLRKRKGGSIIYVSSVVGFKPYDMLGAYSVSKTALFGLTKAVSYDLIGENIRVNCLAPGIIDTKSSYLVRKTEAITEATLSLIPMKRFGLPHEMSGVVSFLVSDDASYITGETLVAAGGMVSRL